MSLPSSAEEATFFQSLSQGRLGMAERCLREDDVTFNTLLVESAMRRNCNKANIPQSLWKSFFQGHLIENQDLRLLDKMGLLKGVIHFNHIGVMEALGDRRVFTARELSREMPGNTPLAMAITSKDRDSSELLPMLQSLVSFGADVNYEDRYGMTPLAWAVFQGTRLLPVVHWMLSDAGADPNHVSR